MDLHKSNPRGRWATQALVVAALAAAPAQAERTVWLVRPLYPGQEALVERTQAALSKLMPGDARQDAVIGLKELAAALEGQRAERVPCFSGDERCADPIDPFVASLGFERVVLIQGGQDEAGFKFRVVAYEPKTGKAVPAVATNATLEKALLGAVARVVPVASTLQVDSTPPGATVYVDDVKVGTTPLNTQVLPGERVVRFDLKLHQPAEETIVIPIRGAAKLERTLDKVAARLVVTASPAGAEISVDGQVVGKDKVDRGIEPGAHVIRITLDQYKAFEQTVTVRADEQFALDKSLEPVPGTAAAALAVQAAPPPPPLTQTDRSYQLGSYFQMSYEFTSLLGSGLVGRRFCTSCTGRTTSIKTAGRMLMGASAEYGTFGRYFGVSIFGVSYVTNVTRFGMNVGHTIGKTQEFLAGEFKPDAIEPVRIHLVTVRALQPQVRLCVGRFQFALQAGLEFRTGQIVETSSPVSYTDGFMIIDLMASAHLSVRFHVGGGFFVMASGNYTQHLFGERSTAADDTGNFRGANSAGFNAGVGYGF
jgi:hypothetical protein